MDTTKSIARIESAMHHCPQLQMDRFGQSMSQGKRIYLQSLKLKTIVIKMNNYLIPAYCISFYLDFPSVTDHLDRHQGG